MCLFVLANVIRVFYYYNRGADIQPELQHVYRILLSRGYIDGTDIYMSGKPFLYFLACLIDANHTAPEVQSLSELVVSALRECLGRRGNSFAVAARMLAFQKLGVWCESGVEYLKKIQEIDGGWKIG